MACHRGILNAGMPRLTVPTTSHGVWPPGPTLERMTARRPGPHRTDTILPAELTNATGERVMLNVPMDVVVEEVGQELRQSLWAAGIKDHEDLTMRTLARLFPRLRSLSLTTHAAQPQDRDTPQLDWP